jgi:Zn-dependent protease with chaperone function
MTTKLGRQAATIVLTVALAMSQAAPVLALDQEQQWETQLGQQQYMQLLQRGEIVQQSPYYSQLDAVGKRIAKVADAEYFAPFHFILLNVQQPNAMAVPGGNVYVTMGMMHFVQNQDELAGVLCHEVSHDIHHDVYNENQKDQRLQNTANVLGMVLGGIGGYGYGPAIGQMALGVGAQAQAMHYSRQAESRADKAGAYLCAQAGFNPWGMVWLFRRMQSVQGQTHQGPPRPSWLADHPSDSRRIDDLENLFRRDPTSFAKFADDESKAKPLPAVVAQQAGPQANPYGRNPYQPPTYGYPNPYPQAPQPGYPQYPPPGSVYPQYPPPGSVYPQYPPPGSVYPQYPPPGSVYPQYPPPGSVYPQYPLPGSAYPQYPPPGSVYPQYPPPGSVYPQYPPQ